VDARLLIPVRSRALLSRQRRLKLRHKAFARCGAASDLIWAGCVCCSAAVSKRTSCTFS
jgi:hypothetical protein